MSPGRYKFSSTSRLLFVSAAAVLWVVACSRGGDGATGSDSPPESLAFTATTTEAPPTTLEPISLGDASNPFPPLPSISEPTAIRTPEGVVLPVLARSGSGYLVQTPCLNEAVYRGGEEIGRAHVVLDPGHGGGEPGAVGAGGSVEKDLNLAVTQQAKALLEQAGATVVLTREADYSLTLEGRAEIANKVKPALFVSVHHNGGAPPGGAKPGTIVFTASKSAEAKRFGGIFYEEITPFFEAAGQAKAQRFAEYEALRIEHEAAVTAYLESIERYNEALEENRRRAETQALQATQVTQVPDQTITTTVIELVPVPEILPEPSPFTLQPVQPFSWAGTGNAGVRSWTTPDGEDFLGVIRHTEDVPAALAEFLYVTNPAEEELLLDPQFVSGQAERLASSIIRYFGTEDEGIGFVGDQVGDQDIGGGGTVDLCVEPELGGQDERR